MKQFLQTFGKIFGTFLLVFMFKFVAASVDITKGYGQSSYIMQGGSFNHIGDMPASVDSAIHLGTPAMDNLRCVALDNNVLYRALGGVWIPLYFVYKTDTNTYVATKTNLRDSSLALRTIIISNGSSYVKYVDTAGMLVNYARTAAVNTLLAGKFNNPSGTNLQYIKGDGTLGTYTTSLGTVTSVGLSSTDFSISGSPVTSSGSITANLNTSGVTAGTYDFVTVNSKGIVTAAYNAVTNSISARTLGTAYQASDLTRTYDVEFTYSISIGAGLISASSATLEVQISANGTSGWVSRAGLGNSNSGVLAAQNGQVAYASASNIPAGYYYRITQTANTGTNTPTYLSGFETLRK